MMLVEDPGDPQDAPLQLTEKQRLCKRMPPQTRGYSDVYDDKFLKLMVAPHVESYNFFCTEGLENITMCSQPLTIALPNQLHTIMFSIKKIQLGTPQYTVDNQQLPLTPQICRDQSLTYAAPLLVNIETTFNNETFQFQQQLGSIPVMLCSKQCVLFNANQQQKKAFREDEREEGGYFIANGVEKLLRLLVTPKYHLPQNMKRQAFLKRGAAFTEYAVSFRDKRQDCRSQTIVLHYLKNGSICVRLLVRKREYFVPLIMLLKALKQTTDYEIYSSIVVGQNSIFAVERVENMLREFQQKQLSTRNQILQYLGQSFRNICYGEMENLNDVEIAHLLLRQYLFFSLDGNESKYQLLCMLARRLFMFANNEILEDNQDATSAHDVLLPGHLFCSYLSEQLEQLQLIASHICMKHAKNGQFSYTKEFFKKQGVFKTNQLEQRFKQLICTGILNSESGLDLLQQNSFSVTADRINFARFLAHFRSIHRGAFFAEMKTIAVRKMLPESFGFLCPVHTPDGAPCGLLNHLCFLTSVVVNSVNNQPLRQMIYQYGAVTKHALPNSIPVLLDGEVLGYIVETDLQDDEGKTGSVYQLTQFLRCLKINKQIEHTSEIIYIPSNNKYKQFPILAIITTPGRYTRRVFNLQFQKQEQISPYEQLLLDIAVFDNEFHETTSHQELAPISMLSTIATLIPFPDHNQSPRNMYECQMLKQTMGFPMRSHNFRTDSKNYVISTPQRQLVRTCTHQIGAFDTHPTGTNAVVAVLSYTGYDMEDACVINKQALERGLFGGSVYATEDIDLMEEMNISKYSNQCGYFKGDGTISYLDNDGLPKIGSILTQYDVLCQYYDPGSQRFSSKKYQQKESGVVERVIISRDQRIKLAVRAKIVIRHDRSPIIGDKFASRHGQKGTLSIKYQFSDLPFCHANGISPDLIINPHAFPSRMTIGMLIDSIGGKLSALNCVDTDATPFQYSSEHRALDQIGDQLEKYGFCKYGSDVMYSGVSGELMPVGIFIGVVYYQRLRHMVNDKYQVRSTGPIDQITHQPIKGRKKGGGTRFGEMERDALLAHGTQAMLRGRLCTDSDAALFSICGACGNTLNKENKCALCGSPLKKVIMPMVANVLIGELAGMGIHMRIKLEDK